MREFAFELELCARLEADGALLARQLGAGVHRPGDRIVDVVVVEPGPGFDDRRALAAETIPDHAIESDVGPGRFRPASRVFDERGIHPETAREVVDRAVDVGFFERERRNGRVEVRQAARYPEDWFDRLVTIENKPDLGRPGDLERQLRRDAALGLADEVVLATASHVTRAHLNRLPEAVGVWRFDGDEIEVVREATPLPVEEPGTEIVEERPGRTEIRPVDAAAKAGRRRIVAERAYGKGWRPSALPACANAAAWTVAGVGGLPGCAYEDRLVDPGSDCGPGCPGFEPDDPPPVDLDDARDRTSPWAAAPAGRGHRQSGLDRFGR